MYKKEQTLYAPGEPLKSEAWWNSSVSTKGKGTLVSCVFLLDGPKASCDVQARSAAAIPSVCVCFSHHSL